MGLHDLIVMSKCFCSFSYIFSDNATDVSAVLVVGVGLKSSCREPRPESYQC